MKNNALTLLILLLFSAMALGSENSAARPNSSEPRLIYFPDCNTLDDLDKFIDNNFVIPEGSSCVNPAIVLHEPKKEPARLERIRAVGLKSSFSRNPWHFSSIITDKFNGPRKPVSFFVDNNFSFEGADLLYDYGASPEYISRLNELLKKGEEVFDANASLRFIADSGQYIAWTQTSGNGKGNITVAIHNSKSKEFLDLDELEEGIIYHELAHIAFTRDFGNYQTAISWNCMADLMWFEEYAVDALTEQKIPKDKARTYVERLKAKENSVSYKTIKRYFDTKGYGIMARSKAREKTHGTTKADEYIDTFLEQALPEFKKKFLELSNEFYQREKNLNKENFKENMQAIAKKFTELRKIDST